MKGARTKSGLSKLRITHLSLCLAAVASCGCYGWYLYTLFRDARQNMPQPQIEKLTRDLRLFHSRTKRFPKDFNEINDLVWRTRPKPDYGVDGRQAHVKNYRYLYTRVNDQQCAIWAFPLGPQRHYASTFFVVLSPDWMRSWKGRAMSDEEMAQIPAIPPPTILTELGMRETPTPAILNTKPEKCCKLGDNPVPHGSGTEAALPPPLGRWGALLPLAG